MTVLRALLLSFLGAAIGLSAGCSHQGEKVSGTLLVNGKPYAAPDKAVASIQFIPADLGTKLPTCSAEPDPKTGAFEVLGPVPKQGVLPGKYKVIVNAEVYGTGKDLFNDAFSVKNTTLTYEVTADPVQKIAIDLGKKSITKE